MPVKVLFVFFLSFYCIQAVADHPLILARAPQLSPSVTSEIWSPFVKYLSKQTQHEIILKTYANRADFENDIKAGNVDLYFGNPGYGVVGHLLHGYLPLIRSDKKLLKGIIVVKKDSQINDIQQLNGKVIAFPAKRAFAASLYIRSRIASDFNINYQPLYTGSHDNNYRTVAIGKAAAGGGVKRTLERENMKLREQLKIIYTTPGMKPHPLMASPDIPLALRSSIQKAILNLNKDTSGKKLLKSIKIQKPVIADYEKDYQPIEPFATQMYQNLLN